MALSLFDFHRELDRQLFGNDLWGRQGTQAASVSPMKMELKERLKTYELTIEAPGIKKEEMKISVDNGVLMVSAEHKEEKQGEDERVHFSERTYGHYSRQIRLPKNVDASAVSAKYENGLLKVEIPKTEKQQPNLIRID